MSFKMHKIIFYSRKKNKKIICMPILYLKFSDLLPETHYFFFIWPYQMASSGLHQKPADPDLQCFQKKINPGYRRTRFIFLLTVPRCSFFCGSFLLFVFRVCHVVLSVVTSWERANLLALLYVMFSCIFVTFPCGVLIKCGI